MQQAIQPPIDDTLTGAREVAERLGARLSAAVRGRDDVVELVLVALLADGHVLLEDYPGSGKTLFYIECLLCSIHPFINVYYMMLLVMNLLTCSTCISIYGDILSDYI